MISCDVLPIVRRAWLGLVVLAACDGSGRDATVADAKPGQPADAAATDAAPGDAAARDAAPDATPCIPPPPGTAPTYAELYTSYFAPLTPGHCATDGCHAGSSFNIWLCGSTYNSCYQGMLDAHLIDRGNPTASLIADPERSPLAWVNPNGPMPQDGTRMFPAGGSERVARDQILAWAAACALDN